MRIFFSFIKLILNYNNHERDRKKIKDRERDGEKGRDEERERKSKREREKIHYTQTHTCTCTCAMKVWSKHFSYTIVRLIKFRIRRHSKSNTFRAHFYRDIFPYRRNRNEKAGKLYYRCTRSLPSLSFSPFTPHYQILYIESYGYRRDKD